VLWSVVLHQVHGHWSLFSPSYLFCPNPLKQHFVVCVVKYADIFLNNCLFESLLRLLLCLNIQNVIQCHSFSFFFFFKRWCCVVVFSSVITNIFKNIVCVCFNPVWLAKCILVFCSILCLEKWEGKRYGL